MRTVGTRALAPSLLAALLATLLALPAGGQQAVPAARGPTLEDLFRVAALGDVQLSPDGEWILYTVRTADLERNRTDTEIWLAPAGGGEPVQLTHNPKNDTRPRWHPRGETFAFLSVRPDVGGPGAGGERAALYRMRARGGEPERLYAHPTSILAFEWSPDGERIAFTARDEETKEEKERKEKGRDVVVEDEPGAFTHLWLFEVASGKARRVTSGRTLHVQSFAWSPDGRRLAFAAAPTPRITDGWRTDLYGVEALDSAAVPRRLTTNPGPDGDPVWTPDGRALVYRGRQSETYEVGPARVYRIAVDDPGAAPEDLSPVGLDLEPSAYRFVRGGSAVLFEATTGTTRALFLMPLATRVPVRLTPPEGVYDDAAVTPDGRRIAYVHESATRPAELYAQTLAARPTAGSVVAARPLTRHNAHAAGWAVGRTELLRWKGADGRTIEGLVVLPAGWRPEDGPRALVTRIHGGPAGVFTQSFQAGSYSANAQWYAADGYAVFLPNPRGSSGYGEEFQRAVVGDWGGLDFQDILAGIDTLVARGIAHPDSLGVMGWSYGGYLTAWAAVRSRRFKAAVAGAAITETISMWATQDIRHVFEAYFGGHPFAEGRWQEYQESSPLAFVREARTPTLILHGTNDERVPPSQASILYRALRALGVPAELVWLPRTPHGPSEPGLQYETARRQKEWLDRWIRGRPAAAAAR